METKFNSYKYYHGEQKCPYKDPNNCTWWNFEKNHYEYNRDIPFDEYLQSWIEEKAAPNSGWNLKTQGNPWLEEYNNKMPES